MDVFITMGVRLCQCGTGSLTGSLPMPEVSEVNMEHRWKETWRGKPKVSKKDAPICESQHLYGFHGRKPRPPRSEADDKPPELCHGLV